MNNVRNTVWLLVMLFGLLVLGGLLGNLTSDAFLLGCATICTGYFLLMSVIFFQYIRRTILPGSARNNLMICSSMIVLFILLRGCKYIAFRELENESRWIWYCYYIPVILMPYHSYKTAITIGKQRIIGNLCGCGFRDW